MEPITSLEEARRVIQSYQGTPDEFRLPIAEALLDPVGMNMAIIVDGVLARSWQPDGYVQEQGFRVYKFKALGS